MCANFKSLQRPEEVKKADRIYKISMARTLNFDADNIVGHTDSPKWETGLTFVSQLILTHFRMENNMLSTDFV